MIIDIQDFEDGAEITADIGIVGAGAAGIALARSFIGSSLRVCAFESGGFEYDDDTQSLYEGESIGREYFALDICRLRFFGGSTNHWGGWSALLTPYDLEAKPWVPHSGWPLRFAELEPYYERAQPVCGLGSFVYDDRLWPEFGKAAPQLDGTKVAQLFWRQRWPFRFGEIYRAELQNATNVQVILNANVVKIETDPQGMAVSGLDIRSLDGRRAKARMKAYVLACGGIENARLLLASNDVYLGGLGNSNDLVGRFFMDNLGARCATVLAANPMEFISRFGKHRVEMDKAWAGFGPSVELQKREQILNGGLWVDSYPDPSSGPMTARNLWKSLTRGELPDDLGRQILNIVTDLDDLALHLSHRALEGEVPPYPPQEVFLFSEAEQAPNPDSRITLSNDRDLLDQRQPVLDWRLSEIDKRSIRVLVEAVGEELGRLNIARVKMEDWLLDDGNTWPDDLRGAYHHTGTTKMSDDPKTGVVDRNCKLHGLTNLFVAGTSVFPTESYINPTLTIVALALRLGDHLRDKLT